MDGRELTDYEKYVFNGIDTKMKLNVSYSIDKERKDLKDFISAIKKRIDLYGDCEFNSDYTKFRKIGTWNELTDKWNTSDSELHNNNKKILKISK